MIITLFITMFLIIVLSDPLDPHPSPLADQTIFKQKLPDESFMASVVSHAFRRLVCVVISCRDRHAGRIARHFFEVVKHREAHCREAGEFPIAVHLLRR